MKIRVAGHTSERPAAPAAAPDCWETFTPTEYPTES